MIPNLIHHVPVYIQRAQPNETIFDPISREPIRQLWKEGQGPGLNSTTKIEGQMNWNIGKIAKPVLNPAGVEEHSTGYVLFRLLDLINTGIATENSDGTIDIDIKRGDLITRVGNRVTKIYVLWFVDTGGYTDQGGSTLLEVRFGDRNPR